MKTCSKCGVPKPVAQFWKDSSMRDGLRAKCKVCLYEIKVQWRADHPEQEKDAGRKRYAANANNERARKAAWRAANPEKVKAAVAKCIAKAPGKHRVNTIKWRLDNPEKARAQVQRRRAAIESVLVERFIDLEIFERDGWICGLCGEAIDRTLRFPDPGSVSLDHILPITKGGHHTRINTQASHFGCNAAKGNRIEETS